MVDHVLRLKLALLASAFRPGFALARTIPVLVLGIVVAVGVIMLASLVDVRLPSPLISSPNGIKSRRDVTLPA